MSDSIVQLHDSVGASSTLLRWYFEASWCHVNSHLLDKDLKDFYDMSYLT